MEKLGKKQEETVQARMKRTGATTPELARRKLPNQTTPRIL